jgi:hypothetical protein
VAGAPFDARPYYASIAEKPGVADFLTVLRTDRPANWPGEEGEADWHAAMRTEALASPANTLAGLMKAHTAHGAQRGPRTALNMPALSAQAQGCREREAEQDPVMQTLEARRR